MSAAPTADRWPPVDDGLVDAVTSYLRDGGPLSVSDRGGAVGELEDALAGDHGCHYGLAMSSGTTAIMAALFACDLQPGDEVVVPAYTYHATASPALHFPVTVVFADVEPITGNVAASSLASVISERTKVLLTNHQWGHPVDVSAIRDVLADAPRPIRWIEDCSHAHYAEYAGERVGQFGDASVFSLQGNKLVPAGEGGVLATNDAEIHDRATLFAYSLARTEQTLIDEHYRSLGRTGVGLKHRMHPLAAVIALYYLRERVPLWLRSRSQLLGALSRALEDVPGVEPPRDAPYVTSRGAFYGYKPRFLAADFAGRISREEYVQRLAATGLAVTLPGSPPLYRLALFADPPVRLPGTARSVPVGGLAGAEAYTRAIISVPTFTNPAELERVEAYATGFRTVSNLLRDEVGVR